jgi:hypothetical protein
VSDSSKPALWALRTLPAFVVDRVLVEGECELNRVVDDIGDNSLVVGRNVAAAARDDVLRHGETDDADLLQHAGALAYLHPVGSRPSETALPSRFRSTSR